MQVGGAQIDGVDQHFLEEANHRCVFDVGELCSFLLRRCVVLGDVEVEFAAGDAFQGLSC